MAIDELELENLRGELDEVNVAGMILARELVGVFVRRGAIVDKVTEVKIRDGIATHQPERFEQMVEGLVPIGVDAGLSETFVRSLFDLIHEESMRQQEATRANSEPTRAMD